MIRVRGNVCDKFLRRKGEEARETNVGLGWRRKTSFGQVVVCYGVRNLRGPELERANKTVGC